MATGRNGQDATVAHPGWYGKVAVDVADPVFSRERDGPGGFSCFLTTSVARDLGFDELLDRWIEFEDPDFGPWRGVIESVTESDDVDATELVARTFHVLLAGWRTRISPDTVTAPPGQLALRAITDVDRGVDTTMLLASFSADTGGEPLEWEWTGEDLAEELDAISRAGNMSWRVDENRAFEMRDRLGRDKTRTVELVAGLNATDARSTRTTMGLVNDLLGIGGDETTRNAQAYVAHVGGSIRRLRRRQATKRYVTLVTKSTLRPQVKADVARSSAVPGTGRVLVPRGPLWGTIREGDGVALYSPAANAVRELVIESIAVDPVRGIMDVSGTLGATL